MFNGHRLDPPDPAGILKHGPIAGELAHVGGVENRTAGPILRICIKLVDGCLGVDISPIFSQHHVKGRPVSAELRPGARTGSAVPGKSGHLQWRQRLLEVHRPDRNSLAGDTLGP